MFFFTILFWILFMTGFLDAAHAVHWGCEASDCLRALLYFSITYALYFVGLRFYISKFFTIACCLLAMWIVIVLAGTVSWLLCIPAVLLGVPLGIGMCVLVWKTYWE